MDLRTGLPVVGMVGGGQLARMTHQAAIPLGQSLRVLVNATDDSAALVAGDVRVGDHTDLEALMAFAKGVDVLTFDHEHVPHEHVKALADAGVAVRPSADALLYAQDKGRMRERLSALGLPVPRWRPVSEGGESRAHASRQSTPSSSITDVEKFAEGVWPVVAKATQGGYDGKGVWLLDGPDEAKRLIDTGTPLIVEEKVPLVRELAAVVARSPYGQVAAYPVVETVQQDGICVEVLAPAPGLSDESAVEAQQIAIRVATELDVVGVLAVELFETRGGLLVNELAMRPHNSAHWTIEGARTSQFEQHLRAVLDYPLGDTSLTAPAVCMANVLGGPPDIPMGIDERLHHLFAADPGAKVHLYGKAVRPGRKIGHVTVVGDDPTEVRARAARAAAWLHRPPATTH